MFKSTPIKLEPSKAIYSMSEFIEDQLNAPVEESALDFLENEKRIVLEKNITIINELSTNQKEADDAIKSIIQAIETEDRLSSIEAQTVKTKKPIKIIQEVQNNLKKALESRQEILQQKQREFQLLQSQTGNLIQQLWIDAKCKPIQETLFTISEKAFSKEYQKK